MREDPDAEPADLRQIQRYITMAREWLEHPQVIQASETGNAA
jgi:hypothetical protein